MLTLQSKIEEVAKIGDFHQKKLNKVGIETVADLLWYFPSRYEDFSNITPIKDMKLGEKCCIAGKILSIATHKTWQKKMWITEALITDNTDTIKAVWFNQPYIARTLKKEDTLYLAGKTVLGKDGISFSSPVYEKIYTSDVTDQKHTARIVPIYPETTGLSSRWLRYILKPLLQHFEGKLSETLPNSIIKEHKLACINKAIQHIHFPDTQTDADIARKRFIFENLFLVELSVLKARMRLSTKKAPPIKFNIELIQDFVKSLPFKLTDAQRKCSYRILKDLEQPAPMSRLLEGDVGSGKTLVAIISALNTVKSGLQVALMAPTEILAKQHFKEVSKLLWPFKVRIALLTGKQDQIISKKLKNELIEISRARLLKKTAEGEIDILIGTHALIQDKVKFGNLGLAIIDEQHRFGVAQRAKLCKNKGTIPHLLSMTATPIPRTLALTVFGDLDLSVIDEMPKGRKQIITKVVPPRERRAAYNFIAKEVKAKKQVFVICPRIEIKEEEETGELKKPSSWDGVKAVKDEYEKLSKDIFPDFNLEMMHGKLKVKEKEKIMKNFGLGKIDILVSTSVVEVGVDIPNATVIMIEGAERFGLAQLHQFRGRVGRNDMQSYCFLFTDSNSQNTKQRLSAIIKAKNGFELAEKDLEIRGPGSLYGTKQWGMPDLAMETLKDLPLVEKTRETAKELLRTSPNLKEYPQLASRLVSIEKQLHLE